MRALTLKTMWMLGFCALLCTACDEDAGTNTNRDMFADSVTTDATGGPTGVCESNSDCPANEPLCAPARGQCVECLSGGDCGAAQPACDPFAGECRQCLADSDCSSGNQNICDPLEFECVDACTSDADCDQINDDLPTCDVATGQCIQCDDDTQCPNDEPICNARGVCVECGTDMDCGAGEPFCIETRGRCRECLDSSHCGVAAPYCIDFECAECLTSAECPVSQPLCNTDGECEACQGICPGDCPEGTVICGQECIDVSNDLDHCGQCGNDCAAGATCVAGQCACPGGEESCGDVCTDVSNDLEHCGQCGNDCPAGADCVSGQCECPGNETACNNECADLDTSTLNCGDCGNACDATFGQCATGQCECTAGLTMCGNNACVDVNNDPQNCGGCGDACADGEMCVAGACACRPGLEACSGACVDTQSNANHCGSCGSLCNDQCYQGNCINENCDNQDPQATDCDPNGDSCVIDTSMDNHPLNCGDCNDACDVDEVCADRNCRAYRVGRDCMQCPCDDCGNDLCCPQLSVSGVVICVDGDTCPDVF